MKNKELNWKLGKNFGGLMLQIGIEKIHDGDFEGAIEFYTAAFPEINRDTVIKILKGDLKVVVCEDCENIQIEEGVGKTGYNWLEITDAELNRLIEQANEMAKISELLISDNGGLTFDYTDQLGSSNFALAREIETYLNYTGVNETKYPYPNFSNKIKENLIEMVERIGNEISDETPGLIEQQASLIYTYTELAKDLFKKLQKFELRTSDLVRNHFISIDNIKFYTNKLGCLYYQLTKFRSLNIITSDTDRCVDHKSELQRQIRSYSSLYLDEWRLNGMLSGNIEDGYDAGWLSPDGIFYGTNGPENALLHMNIAESLSSGKGTLSLEIKNSNLLPEQYLEKVGWLKTHHSNVYGYFRYDKNSPDGLYAPTNQQILALHQMAKKNYGGRIYINGDKTETKTSDLLNMDEIALHNAFI